MTTKKLLKDPISMNLSILTNLDKELDKFDKAKWEENYKKHCELYFKYQPKEERDFYDKSIRLHMELMNKNV